MNIATSNLLVETANSFDYTIIETIQTTSQRIIYRGKRNSDSTLVSIKKPLADYPSVEDIIALQNENRIARNLQIKGIIKPYQLERYRNSYVAILENIEGEFLDRWLLQRKFNLVDSLQIAISLARILAEIHHNGIIHKNIQPANIIIDPKTLAVKILDFSLATNLDREVPIFSNVITSEQTDVVVKEKFAYISPEQTGRMNRAIDYRSDFYSLGVTFYEILTDNLPFNTDNLIELIYSHLALQPIAPNSLNLEIPPIVSEIALKLLSKNAEDRYQTTQGLIADLQTCLDCLSDRGTISEFTLGSLDRSSQLLISQKLYGRDLEIANLISIVDRVSIGEAAIVAVTGYSGIGKTSVVNEIHKSLAHKQGYFIAGKFDQLKRNIPYAALIEAFRTLLPQLFIQTPEKIEYWRNSILSSLGNNARIITEVIPELETIVGTQPKVPVLGLTEARNRFDRVFKEFIRVFARREHPLVIFLDDLQWADSASLRSIELLLSDTDTDYLLIIGAYRDNEVTPIHPLIKTLEKIAVIRPINYINLQPLQFQDVSQLIADTLGCEAKISESLAKLIFGKAGGNPFFTDRLLKTLYAEKLLVFDRNQANSDVSWNWSIDKILSIGITDYDAVELVARNLQQLPESTQQILQLAACMGNRFDLNILAIINQKSQLETAKELWEAIQTGAILPLGDVYKISLVLEGEAPDLIPIDSLEISYKFLHDRVQLAAYASIPEAQKQEIHLKIGNLILKKTPEARLEEQIFEIVNQLNFGWKIIVDRDKKLNLAKLNLMAAKKAKIATAYGVAIRYLNIGLELLPESIYWETHYELILDLHIEAVEAEYLNTNFDRAETLSNIVLLKAKTLLAKVKVYETKIQYYIAQSKMKQAIDLAISVLKMLKIDLPRSPNQINIIIKLLATKLAQGRKPIEALATLPEMSDPYKLAAMGILEAMIPAAFVANPQLFPLVIFQIVNLSLKHGNTALSLPGYGGYGLIHCAILGDIQAGYRYAELSLTLLERLNSSERKAKTYLVFNTFIRHWKEHLKKSLEPLLEGVQSGLETGNIEDACYCATHYCGYLFLSGENLENVIQKQRQYIDLMVQYKQEIQIHHAQIWGQTVLNLIGDSANPVQLTGKLFDEETSLPSLIQANDNQGIFAIYLVKSFLCYLFKDYDQSLKNSLLTNKYGTGFLGTSYIPLHNFYYSLTLLALYSTSTRSQQKQYLQQVKSHQRQMQKWATHAPTNYLHKYELVEAETARVLGNNDRAALYYDRAIELSMQSGYLQEEALASELAAEFYFSQNRKKIATVYLIDAYYGYIGWGARAKVKDLEAIYPNILPLSNGRKTNNADRIESAKVTSLAELDIASVIEASQTISSEIILDKLLYKLMNILMENAGAQKGLLFLKQEDSWIVAAEAIFKQQQEIVLPYVSITANSEIPSSIINYIQSTKETIILDRANTHEIFANDSYIAKYQIQSILAAPIIYQNKLQGIIYLENRLIRGVFTAKKLEILKILISQVSISIENARLYEDRDVVKKSLQEKEILLKEIHHRVKNNLFVVSSLLEFQADYIKDPEVIKMLADSQNRINSMALVHEHLYGTSDLEKIDFHKYTQSLIENLAYAYAAEEKGIEFSIDIDAISLNIESANPCGLIINELISNSLKHAFVGRTSGHIWVNFYQNEARQIVLNIKDNGIGCLEELDFYTSGSLGLKLVETLVEQLEGKIKIEQNNGISTIITFSELDYVSRI